MKNNAKKILAFLLAALLCVTMVVPAFAAEEPADPMDAISEKVYADIDFYANGTMADTKGKLTLSLSGATIADSAVTFNGTTLIKPTLNTFKSGHYGQAKFNEFATEADANAFWNDADGFSFEAFFINRAHSGTQGVFCSTQSAGLGLALTGAGKPGLCLYTYTTSASYQYTNPDTALSTTEYAHVVATSITKDDGIHTAMYVNGVLVASNDATDKQANATIYTSNTNYKNYFATFQIGNDPGPSATSGRFPTTNFSVADIKVYGAALTAAEVTTIYNSVKAEFTAPTEPDNVPTAPEGVYADIDFNADGTMVDKYNKLTLINKGATISETVVPFNGTTTTLPTLNVTASGQYGLAVFNEFKTATEASAFWTDEDGFSFEAFFINRAHNGTQGVFCSTQGAGLGLALTGTGKPGLCLYTASGKYSYTNPAEALPTTEYAHVVATTVVKAEGVYTAMYVNGELVESNDATDNQASGYTVYTATAEYAPFASMFCIGNDPGANGFPTTNFSIADIKVYDKALEAADVKALYNDVAADFTGSSFEEVNVSLGEDISVNYYVNKGELTAPTMKFTLGEYTKTVTGVLVENDTQYKFVFDGVAPNYIGDNISAELYDGETLVGVKNYSVLKYLNALKASDAAALGMTTAKYDAMQTLVADLLVYGGAAQTYTGHEGTNVATGVTGTTFETLTTTAKDVSGNTGTNAKFTSANVWFNNANKLMFTFTTADIDNVAISVTTASGDVAYTVRDNKDGTYTIFTDAIKATGFDTVYTVTAGDSTIKYSVAAYVYVMQNSANADMAALAKATYNYGLAAKAFAAAN